MKSELTPEQQRKQEAQKIYYDRYKERKKAGLIPPAKKPFTIEERRERKRASHLRYQQRKKEGLIGKTRVYVTSGTEGLPERKFNRIDTDYHSPIRKPAVKLNEVKTKAKCSDMIDESKIPVMLDHKTTVFVKPGYNLEELRAKYRIGHEHLRS